MKHNKTAFSFVELILVLIILFVILASFMPMITRRHLNPPTKANHGTYACYRGADGGLRQTLIKGTKTIENDVPVTTCTFDPPKKARYFYVQIIGGGGAGQQISASGVTPESNSSYRIKGKTNTKTGYVVEGCTKIYEAGSGYSYANVTGGCGWASGDTHSAYPINSFSSLEEFKELVKDYKVAVYGTGYKGRHCTQSTGNTSSNAYKIAGIYCTDGRIFDITTCEAPVFDDGESFPDDVYSYTDKPDSAKYYMKECTNIGENHECLMCGDYDKVAVTNHCDPENGVTEGCFKSKIYMKIDDCENKRIGQAGDFYAQIPLARLFKTTIKSALYNNNKTSIVYNGYTAGKANDGVGQQFTWKEHDKTNSSSVIIKGGTGAVKGMPEKENPYYGPDSEQKKKSSMFCSTPHNGVNTPNTYAVIQPDYNGEEDDSNTLRNAHCLSSEPGIQCFAGPGTASYDDVSVFDFKKLQISDMDLYQEQVIPYGIGGKAGQIKTLIFKELKENIPMDPGHGGVVGSTNQNGGDTKFGGGESGIPEKIALGGAAGNQTFTSNVPIHPYGEGDASKIFQWIDPGHWRTYTTANITARKGGNISYNSYLKFIISYRNENIINIMKNFGAGGHGTASKTECTLGYKFSPLVLLNNNKFINHILPGERVNVAPQQLFDISRGMKCNGKYEWTQTYNNSSSYYHPEYNPDPTKGIPEGYWKGAVTIDEDATNGGSGAVVISW